MTSAVLTVPKPSSSPTWQRLREALRRHPTAIVGSIVLAVMVLIALLAPWLAPWLAFRLALAPWLVLR